ncbi:hypothetical protein KQX54_019822 [Cotesia glomerata]|uniref:Uncharacterized protein n=1 Tax=Cotesia glomerata TaxID=32391 RepID=A0AAV7J8T1_COTGL|nr:hypothetical protein KQX54_019822 [Cotesia glomerata]
MSIGWNTDAELRPRWAPTSLPCDVKGSLNECSMNQLLMMLMDYIVGRWDFTTGDYTNHSSGYYHDPLDLLTSSPS